MFAALKKVIERHWGFRSLRPLQEPAMQAVLDGRDSVVVMPTGGGKSLCYQAPAAFRGDTTIVISPLIALMKDQVDSLRSCGVAAIQIDSTQSLEQRSVIEQDVLAGAFRLLFVSPERLQTPGFQQLMRKINVRTFAIDEAHCISHWGHDFRPEYRGLQHLKQLFPEASVHAYTATATERVREDISKQLCLVNPAMLVGNFDRPNLTYRIIARHDSIKQVREVLDRHAKESGIIYTLRRRDVDELAEDLQKFGYKAQPYHAGMAAEERRRIQEMFAAEKADIIVATIAFGMGIDRSNIRFVLHATMPKTVEHYQQETGRAGRDGLEAECVLLYSGEDLRKWNFIIEKSASEPGVDASFLPGALKHLDEMDRYCRGATCRHKALVGYFGQQLEVEARACDLCLGDTVMVPEAAVVAQKILSCVARVKEGFGINHVSGILRGENTEAIRSRGHDKLSTYGLLREHSKPNIRDWVYQLIGQGYLRQEGEEYPVLKLNEASWQVMRKERPVRLVQLARRDKGERPSESTADTASREGVERGLFEELRSLRRQLAEQRQVAAYVIFSDATLREMARVRPSSLDKMLLIYGVGDTKLRDFGAAFLQVIRDYAQASGILLDQKPSAVRQKVPAPPSLPNANRDKAFQLFREGMAIAEVAQQVGMKESTVHNYLLQYIQAERPADLMPWMDAGTYDRVAAAARQHGTERLKPLYIALEEKIPYDDIRLVVEHLLVRAVPGSRAGRT